jgi:hypothetical protein
MSKKEKRAQRARVKAKTNRIMRNPLGAQRLQVESVVRKLNKVEALRALRRQLLKQARVTRAAPSNVQLAGTIPVTEATPTSDKLMTGESRETQCTHSRNINGGCDVPGCPEPACL